MPASGPVAKATELQLISQVFVSGFQTELKASTDVHLVWHQTSRVGDPRTEVDTLIAQHGCDLEVEGRQSGCLRYAMANHNGPGAAKHVELVLSCSRGDQIGLAFVASQVSAHRLRWSRLVQCSIT